MRYLIALFLPPLAVASCGKVLHLLVSVGLWVLAWLAIGIIGPFALFIWLASLGHAWMVCSAYYAQRRAEEIAAIVAATQVATTQVIQNAAQPHPVAALPAPVKVAAIDPTYDPKTGRYNL